MKNKVVIFDLDDTLIKNQIYYEESRIKLVALFKKFFGDNVNGDEVIGLFKKIDLEKVKKLKLNRARFPLSAVETYIEYCKIHEKSLLQDELDEVFVTVNETFDFVETLTGECADMLNKVFIMADEVFVLTAGDEVVQSHKIYQSGLHEFIESENIIIVPHKDDETYSKYFEKYGFENCVMIGNSKKSDINPALAVGMKAIYIPQETWDYEAATLKESDNLYTIQSLTQIPDTLKLIWS